MKTLILFFLTCFIATLAFLAATSLHNKLPAFIVGFGVWILFLWYFVRRISK